ncbi:hypothetical protein M885DRAFT_30725 [Pelagophyceae sp. CCMP2097]|nr:hypothetical protein M885DRAFT_30725 [Pelagophyceae sp. CCMP2097]
MSLASGRPSDPSRARKGDVAERPQSRGRVKGTFEKPPSKRPSQKARLRNRPRNCTKELSEGIVRPSEAEQGRVRVRPEVPRVGFAGFSSLWPCPSLSGSRGDPNPFSGGSFDKAATLWRRFSNPKPLSRSSQRALSIGPLQLPSVCQGPSVLDGRSRRPLTAPRVVLWVRSFGWAVPARGPPLVRQRPRGAPQGLCPSHRPSERPLSRSVVRWTAPLADHRELLLPGHLQGRGILQGPSYAASCKGPDQKLYLETPMTWK